MNIDSAGQVVAITYKGRAYDHYAILDGDGNAIHINKKKGYITRDPLDKVLRGAIAVAYIDDDLRTRLSNYSTALSLVGSKHNYRFFTDNCETWTNKIRTGRAYSRQIDNAASTLAAGILALAGILAVSGH